MMTSHDTVKCRRSSWPQRPIVMTTMSIFASPAPVALGTEARSELLKAAALVPIGGLLTSTLLTLVFVPAIYAIFNDMEESSGD
jgi:hydrophobic/amphiphilic exporter-1 (mainly G- bacteria), HAE1 family